MRKYITFVIFALALAVNIYFGFQKSGFHEDEYYTYFSSNRSIGLYQPDREWQDKQVILDEFVVKDGEGFNYSLVKLVQSWDVHPPLYYFIFHTVCSFIGAVFTKWSGIITNLIAFAISFYVFDKLLIQLKCSDYLRWIILVFWGLNPQTVSCNLLIRMYAWLTLFVFLCAFVHIRFVQAIDKGIVKNSKDYFLKYLLPIMVISYLGFLTQYFYLFFFVGIGFSMTVWMFFGKKQRIKSIIYVICCGVSLAAAVLTYPASVHHIFGGYRGNEAAGSLFDLGSTFLRMSFFTGLVNDFVFAGLLWLIVIAIAVAILVRLYGKKIQGKKKDNIAPELLILIIATVFYFLMTAKCALLVGSASNRYEMPVYGLMIAIVIIGADHYIEISDGAIKRIAVIAILGMILFKGFVIDKKVLFLYPEDVAKVQYASDNQNEVAIVMFNPVSPHNVWRLTDELLQYQEVYYMDEENLEELTDERILNADKIVLYVADNEYQEKALQNLMDSAGLYEMNQIFTEDMWKTFELK